MTATALHPATIERVHLPAAILLRICGPCQHPNRDHVLTRHGYKCIERCRCLKERLR